MTLPKRYDLAASEAHTRAAWQANGTYHFAPDAEGSIFSIDTPPPTVSGNLHLGHVYSYSQTDFMARFWRMNGYTIFYPMGYDDNGLPTERLVEKRMGVNAQAVGRKAFVAKCLEISAEAEQEYQELWQRLGLSVDWRYTYRSIDDDSRRISQHSFIDLYRKGLAYRRKAPTIWCPECQTALAQADLNDLERESEFVTLAFQLADGTVLPIATTRAELLPACVAIFVHPDDARYQSLVGQQATVPLFGQLVPIIADASVERDKGTGAAMCCTFGDTADVEWWYSHDLPLVEVINKRGRMADSTGQFAKLPVASARQRMITTLDAQGLVLHRQPTTQTVRVHERCDTPVEYIVTAQWFIRVLEFKTALLQAGEQLEWHPAHMQARYREWVENLGWDWLISRQRFFGVTFPVWYCDACGAVIIAEASQLPVDPTEQAPLTPCACGGTAFTPEIDVMDTWATSSLTPQIVGRWLSDPALYGRVFPMALRTQAHEIIRTWAFYTIVKSLHHFGVLPWNKLAISGWALAPEGTGKISKSRGGGPMAPLALLDRYGADAARYWAASAGFGKDTQISEEKIQTGAKLVNKLWNVAVFSQSFWEGYQFSDAPPALLPTDQWLLARLQRLVRRTTALFTSYEYAAAKNELESFFWRELADNYLELAKQRLYDGAHPHREAAQYTLYYVLETLTKLFAPFLPFVTEAIYQGCFAHNAAQSVHRARWPSADATLDNAAAEAFGETLISIATTVRRYKSERQLSMGAQIARLQVATDDAEMRQMLRVANVDLQSVTRARFVEISNTTETDVQVFIEP